MDDLHLRGYRAQNLPPTRHFFDVPPDPEPEPEATWPQRRAYRAYSQADDDAVAAIMDKYGIVTREDAIRLALRLVAGDAVQIKVRESAAKQTAKIVLKVRARPRPAAGRS